MASSPWQPQTLGPPSTAVQRLACTDILKPDGLQTQLDSAEANILCHALTSDDCTTLPSLINDLRSQFDVLTLKVEHSNCQWAAAITRQDQACSRHEGLLERISDAVHRMMLADEARTSHQQLQPTSGSGRFQSQCFSLAPALVIPEAHSVSATLLTSPRRHSVETDCSKGRATLVTSPQRHPVEPDCTKGPTTCKEARPSNGRRSMSDGFAITPAKREELASNHSRPNNGSRSMCVGHTHTMSDELAITRAKREELAPNHNRLQRLVSNRRFESFFGLLLLSNALFIGYQVQYQSTFAEVKDAGGMAALGYAYSIGFTLEWCLRVLAFGPIDFFRFSKDRSWNIFDTLTVSVMVFELVITSIFTGRQEALQNVGVLRMIRVLRLLRVLRIVRSLRFFGELRWMICSIMNCAKTLIWAMLLLAGMFYIFGVCLTQGIAGFCEDNLNCADEGHASHLAFFGSIPRSVYTLYMAMSGGISWGEPGLPLSDAGSFFVIVYISFVTFATFAIVNIVTSVFVEVTVASAQSDREAMTQDAETVKESLTNSMREIFAEVDGAMDGVITIAELDEALVDPRLKSCLVAMDLDVDHIKELFVLCDLDQSGIVDIDEFVDGAMRLGGAASSLDVASLKFSIVTRLNEVMRCVNEQKRGPQSLRQSEVLDFAPRLLRSVARRKSSHPQPPRK